MLRTAFLASAVLSLVTIYVFFLAGNWFYDSTGHLRLHDFAVFWAAAKRVLADQAGLIYDRRAHEAFEASLTGQPIKPGLAYPYPPDSLLMIWPLGLLSYGAAWLAFALTSLMAWYIVLCRIVRDRVLARGMCLALGAATQCLLLGQNGFVTAALVCGAMLLLPQHKNWAGMAIGLLSLKPHLAAPAFLALLIWREWRALGAALGTVLVLLALTTIVFGPEIWFRFAAGNAAFADYVAASRTTLIEPMMQSTLALALRIAGWPQAWAMQGLTALLALFVLSLLKQSHLRGAALPAAIMLVTPFSYFYDTTMLVGGAAFLLRGARGPIAALMIAMAALLPGLWFMAGGPYGSICAMLILALTLKQANAPSQPTVTR